MFIHGWALDREMWEPQARALRDEFRILRMDRHGFGTSHAMPSLTQDVVSIRALIEQLDLHNVALVGMSQGARVAMALAESIPDRFACLVLDGAPWECAARPEVEPEVPIAQYRQILRTQGVESLRAHLRRHPFVRLREPQPESLALLERMIARYTARDLQSPATALVHRVSAIRTPTLVINGEHDSVARRAMGDALAVVLPHAARAMIANAGHLANLDNPAAYNAILKQFIVRHRVM
jgi:pimeloyl-ACP methyl ester carboxylesterase